MKEEVYLSIIIPVYNVIDYLDKCVDSVKIQNNELVEAIFINDGSTDGSDIYLEEICKGIENFKIIHKKNGGLSSARNIGIKEAKGKYIILLDSDDALSMGSLQKVISCLKKNEPDVLMVDYIRTWVDGGQHHSTPTITPQKNKLLDINNDDVLSGIYDSSEIYPWKYIIKSDIYTKHPFVEGVNFEDIRSIPLLISSSKTFFYTPLVFIRYLQRNDSLMRTINLKNVMDLSSSTTFLRGEYKKSITISKKSMFSHDVFSMKVFVWSIQNLITSGLINCTEENYKKIKENLDKSLFMSATESSKKLRKNNRKIHLIYKLTSNETLFKIIITTLRKVKLSSYIMRFIYRKYLR